MCHTALRRRGPGLIGTSNSRKGFSRGKEDEWLQNSLGFIPESDDHRGATIT